MSLSDTGLIYVAMPFACVGMNAVEKHIGILMYQAHFGLTHQPFINTPDTEHFFTGGNRGAILEALVYAISNGEAIVKIVGEVGAGKTMLCRMLETKLPSTVDIVYLANPSLSPENILHAIAQELGLAVTYDNNKLQVLQVLQQKLLHLHSQNRQVVVLVEEAQCMPLATLEEIRLLSNLETQHHKLIQVVLFGQPELDEKLSVPEMRQLVERISHAFYLESFTFSEVNNYITFRLNSASEQVADFISPKAVRSISRYSRGLARRVNFLTDKSLLAAYSENKTTVDSKHVRLAARDCEFRNLNSKGVVNWAVPAFVMGLIVIAIIGVPKLFVHSLPVVTAVNENINHQSPQYSDKQLAKLEQVMSSIAKDYLATEKSVNTVKPSADIQKVAKKLTSKKENTVKTLVESMQQKVTLTRERLANVDPDNYTIQIMTSFVDRPNELRGLEKILRKKELQPLSDKFYIHQGILKKQTVYVLSFASYPDYQSALNAMKLIPSELIKFQPIVRTVRSLHNEIRG